MKILKDYVYKKVRPAIFWIFIVFVIILIISIVLPHFIIQKKYHEHFEKLKQQRNINNSSYLFYT